MPENENGYKSNLFGKRSLDKRSLTGIILHVAFLIKERKPVLTPEMLVSLEQYFLDVIKRWDGQILEYQGEANQVHLLIEVSPDRIIADLINQLKTCSSRSLRLDYPQLRKLANQRGSVLWDKGYFAASCNGVEIGRLDKSFAAPYLNSGLGTRTSEKLLKGNINQQVASAYSKVYEPQPTALSKRFKGKVSGEEYTKKIAQLIKTRRQQKEAANTKYEEAGLEPPTSNIDRKMSFHFEGRTSTKILLILVAQSYGLTNQSKIMEDILLPRLIKLLENVNFDWLTFLKKNDLYDSKVHDQFASGKEENKG